MKRVKAVFIGASAGGVSAVQKILEGLGAPPPFPIFVTQHLPAHATLDLNLVYGRFFKGELLEAVDKIPFVAGSVFFAPPGYHMQVERQGYVSLNQDEPVHFSRPSIDVMFESAAWAFGADVCGIVLTGANQDGAEGLKAIKRAGGVTVVQDPLEAEAPVMPQAAIAACGPDYILRLERISALIGELADAANEPETEVAR